MDYEFSGVDEIEPDYAPLRPPFSQSFSPALPAGLNLARQLFWQQRRLGEAFALGVFAQFLKHGAILVSDPADDDRVVLIDLGVAIHFIFLRHVDGMIHGGSC